MSGRIDAITRLEAADKNSELDWSSSSPTGYIRTQGKLGYEANSADWIATSICEREFIYIFTSDIYKVFNLKALFKWGGSRDGIRFSPIFVVND